MKKVFKPVALFMTVALATAVLASCGGETEEKKDDKKKTEKKEEKKEEKEETKCGEGDADHKCGDGHAHDAETTDSTAAAGEEGKCGEGKCGEGKCGGGE